LILVTKPEAKKEDKEDQEQLQIEIDIHSPILGKDRLQVITKIGLQLHESPIGQEMIRNLYKML